MNSTHRFRNQQGGRSDQRKQSSGSDHRVSGHDFDTNNIVLTGDTLPAKLFSEVAENAAKYVAGGKPDAKPTQLRKFYDEICMWYNKCSQSNSDPDRLKKDLPFILMLKAKVTYARGRGHVNRAYENVINRCLADLENTPETETLRHVKTFMEAFTGFYKVHGPK